MATRLVIAMTLLVVITITVVSTSPASPAHAQAIGGLIRPVEVDDSLPPLADLSIEADFAPGGLPRWRLNVVNNTVGRHPGVTVSAVKVRITIYDQVSAARPVVTGNIQSTEVWDIRNLAPDTRAQRETLSPIPPPTADDGYYPYYIYAEIIETDPMEPPDHQHNNYAEHWAMGFAEGTAKRRYFANGNFWVGATASEYSPKPGEETTFTVFAASYPLPGLTLFYPNNQTGTYEYGLFDVKVKISLSQGLEFSETQQTQTATFDPSTGIWDVGRIEEGLGLNNPSLPVMVNLTNDSTPLEKRCLTAELVSAIPWFALHHHKRDDDATTVCLGAAPPVLLSDGYIVLFNPYDCVGVTSRPCTSEDTVEMVAEARQALIDLPRSVRVDSTPTASRGVTYLQPETIVVQVRDHAGRYYDSHTGSVTDGNTVSWHTGRASWTPQRAKRGILVEGVEVKYTRRGFNDNLADWSRLVRTVSVSGLGGGPPPGRVKIRFDSYTANIFYDPNPTHERPYTLTNRAPTTSVSNYFVEFGTLGTYLVGFKVDAVRSDAAMTTYTDAGTYTFHVGPVAELEIRDAGANPGVATGEQAYRIMALNNGPDGAPAVRVTLTGVPRDAEAVTDEGSYAQGTCENGLCGGTWTIGKLSRPDIRRSHGQTEGPTLTLITDDPTALEVTATIENTQDYSVVIDGTTHSTHYYDYIDDNNSATIAARADTLEPHPDATTRVRVTETSLANVLRWDPVDRVNGFAVTRYEVERQASAWEKVRDVRGTLLVDMDLNPGQQIRYRVRAVNIFGVPGPWSAPTTTGPDAPGDFTAEQLQGGDVELTWTKPDGNGAEITGYTIQVSTNSGGSWSNTSASPGADETGWVHRHLSFGPTRIYRIRASTEHGHGAWAEATSPDLVAPTLIANYESATEITLSWSMPSGNQIPVQAWELHHSRNGGNWTRLATVLASEGMSYTHGGLSPGESRYYRVRAVTALGPGPWSETAAQTTAAGVPRNFRAEANGPNEIVLTWSKPAGQAEIWEYQIQRKTEGADWSQLTIAYREAETSYVDSGLSAGGTWTYRIRAMSFVGGSILEGDWSPEVSATTDAGGPESPKDLAAEADGENAIMLSWTEPADNGSPITGYRIEHSTDGGATWALLRARHTGTSYRHSGLESGTTHHYRVAAINQSGTSTFASVVSATTGGDATTVPGIPMNLRVTSTSSSGVSLAWDSPDDDGGARVTGYEYKYIGPCAGDPTDLCESDVKRASGTSASISGLSVAGTYDFLVRAINAVGVGEWSDPVQADIAPVVQGKVIVSPASLTVNEGGTATYRVRLSHEPSQPIQLGLFWDDPGKNLSEQALAAHQGMLLLPNNYSPPEGANWEGWAYRWNVGIPITVEAVEDDDAEGGTVVIEHEVWTAPADLLGNPEDWAEDPIYHFMSGPAVKVTVRDDD